MIEKTTVTVYKFGGKLSQMVVVEDLGNILLLTREEEWAAALRENRVPISIGFKKEYVVPKKSIEKSRNLVNTD